MPKQTKRPVFPTTPPMVTFTYNEGPSLVSDSYRAKKAAEAAKKPVDDSKGD